MLARIYYCGCGSLSQIAGNDLGAGRHEMRCTNSHPLPSLACLRYYDFLAVYYSLTRHAISLSLIQIKKCSNVVFKHVIGS